MYLKRVRQLLDVKAPQDAPAMVFVHTSEVNEHMADNIVVKAKIKDVAHGYNVAGDFSDALDKKVRTLIRDAVARAEGNNRKTVMAKDL